MRYDEKIIEAVAEAWASIDGKLDKFKSERDAKPPMDYDDPEYGGYYEGYLADAEELLTRIKARGYTIVSA